VRSGQRVLINGAGGGVGSIAVQLAKAFGAEVTGVDRTEKLDMVRSLGADRVIDYTQEDFTRRGERYDLILDVPGNHSLSEYRRALAPDGTYVFVGHDHYGAVGRRVLGSLPRALKLMALSPFVRQLPPASFSTPDRKESMAVLSELIADGKITPVVDRTFPLNEVPEALRHLESGRGRGKVVVIV
jgi:NADPH:quinone reductase-like Zn-dependent oxidoreductase